MILIASLRSLLYAVKGAYDHHLVEICRAVLQILRSDWLSHRALFAIVHDEHKQDGGRAFLQSLRRGKYHIYC